MKKKVIPAIHESTIPFKSIIKLEALGERKPSPRPRIATKI